MNHGRRGRLARLFGSSVVDQAMLSAANFAIGLVLIRYSSDVQYGYYILAFNTMMLLTTLQGTFIGTPLVIRLPGLDAETRCDWLGSLLRDQRRLGAALGAAAFATIGAGWYSGWIPSDAAQVALAATALVLAALYREYFRGVLLMYQRPHGVLAADALHVACLLAACLLAVRVPQAAAALLLASAASAVLSGWWLRAQLRGEINFQAPSGRLAHIARVGVWAASGGVIYWLFNQGYSFLTAATLDLTAVAALAATRLLLMPINLLSAGMQKQLTPIAAGWLHEDGASATLRRLLWFSGGMGAATVVYGALVWLMRDWIFLDLMRKDFAQRDAMLLMWVGLFLMMSMREPLMLLAVLRQRF